MFFKKKNHKQNPTNQPKEQKNPIRGPLWNECNHISCKTSPLYYPYLKRAPKALFHVRDKPTWRRALVVCGLSEAGNQIAAWHWALWLPQGVFKQEKRKQKSAAIVWRPLSPENQSIFKYSFQSLAVHFICVLQKQKMKKFLNPHYSNHYCVTALSPTVTRTFPTARHNPGQVCWSCGFGFWSKVRLPLSWEQHSPVPAACPVEWVSEVLVHCSPCSRHDLTLHPEKHVWINPFN